MDPIPVIKGAATYIPGISSFFLKKRAGAANSATYCYEVWMKHLTILWNNGMHYIPETVAELGPGDSLGVGVAALLSGVKNYYAFDVISFANVESNLRILHELVDLFKKRAGRPSKGWPDYDQYLNEQLFPAHILTEQILADSLSVESIQRIEKSLANTKSFKENSCVRYFVPWNDDTLIAKSSVDLLFSHAVLEHVADLAHAYQSFSLWLKQGGWMSHQIDFRCHGLSEKWNAQWTYPEWLWKIIVGKRPYLLNRQPCSTHVNLLEENGFDITCLLKQYNVEGYGRSSLADPWKQMADEDITCAGAFIQARKR
jgi:hypothetical protein